MGVHDLDYEQFGLTGFYALGPRYLRELEALTAYQKRVASEHVGAVGAQLINYLVAHLDYRKFGASRPNNRETPLERLANGHITEEVVIGDRTSLELFRKFGVVIIDGVIWHTVH